jgi:dipeptidyl aminopeptidase/acylaminoacyl peptidase
MYKTLAVGCLLSIISAAGCYAQTPPIAYAAREYYPPSSKRTSHFHLYLINPDGSGKRQLTQGEGDERSPRWSPDGAKLLYLYEQGKKAGYRVLDVKSKRTMDVAFPPLKDDWYVNGIQWLADSHRIAVHIEGPAANDQKAMESFIVSAIRTKTDPIKLDGHVYASPNGKSSLTMTADNKLLLTVGKAAPRPIDTVADRIVWLSDGRFATLRHDETQGHELKVFGANGSVEKPLKLVDLKPSGKFEWAPNESNWQILPGRPGKPDEIVLAMNTAHDLEGARRIWTYYWADTAKSTVTEFKAGKNFSWSPDGKSLAWVPPTDMADYGNKKQVYTASLFITNLSTGKSVRVGGKLTWVWSADWRTANK